MVTATTKTTPTTEMPDFAEKILWLLDNPDERKRMGDFGRRRVECELAWEYSVENLLAAYRRCFDKKVQSRMRLPIGAAERRPGKKLPTPK